MFKSILLQQLMGERNRGKKVHTFYFIFLSEKQSGNLKSNSTLLNELSLQGASYVSPLLHDTKCFWFKLVDKPQLL